MALHPDAIAAGVRLVAFDTVGSTNVEAFALLRGGEPGPLWVTARRQTSGRGRRGNTWTAEPGNLYASLLMTDVAPPAHMPELCFVVALAVRAAVCEVAPGVGAALKWPNDVLVRGAKLCGILIEAETIQGQPASVVIGIGINCAHHPAGTPYGATDLAAEGQTVTPDEMLTALSHSMLAQLAAWDRGAGFAAIREQWLAHAAGIGQDITVRLPDRELTGRFETIDTFGRLMLGLPDGRIEAISAGEVFAPGVTRAASTASPSAA